MLHMDAVTWNVAECQLRSAAAISAPIKILFTMLLMQFLQTRNPQCANLRKLFKEHSKEEIICFPLAFSGWQAGHCGSCLWWSGGRQWWWQIWGILSMSSSWPLQSTADAVCNIPSWISCHSVATDYE